MKPICFLVGISAFGVALAQQPAALPPTPTDRLPPDISVPRPEYARPPAPPGVELAADNLVVSNELKQLIRLQTDAIRVLSGKIDSMEDRLRRIESRLR